jgi:hypothetical protein
MELPELTEPMALLVQMGPLVVRVIPALLVQMEPLVAKALKAVKANKALKVPKAIPVPLEQMVFVP